MNAVEIEQAISELAAKPFDRAEFPFEFLAAVGNKQTTIDRLRSGNTNKSDIPGGVLQRGNIHLATCDEGKVSETFAALSESPQTEKFKAKMILATDGNEFQAQDLIRDAFVSCNYPDLAEDFAIFFPLAGIDIIGKYDDSIIDIRATGRLNRLYVELLRHNPDWATDARRHDMNHFMARLIFCFFAEDTDIFVKKEDMFTDTVKQMSDDKSGNAGFVISSIFRAMDTPPDKKADADLPNWAKDFPYVNGSLFEGACEVPEFSRSARNHLLHVGKLDWKAINPDIFGSMIQVIVGDEERDEDSMHYTSVPNILKALEPLFLNDLRAQLDDAGDNPRKLLNLKKRMARIRVFDPACGSGNFLVIAYREMRAIEAEINERRGEQHIKSAIPLNNYRGIEVKDFPAEIARLALVIAEFQCDVRHRGQREAVNDFLPLDRKNWITRGNALQLNWFDVCPPTGEAVRYTASDLFQTPLDQTEIDFENEGGETYICGNPPFGGSTKQTPQQKADLKAVFESYTEKWRSLDYVAGWFMKAAEYGLHTPTKTALVSTNSICQGQIVPILWPLIFKSGHKISFAHTSFKWKNLASQNAGVTVVIVGISSAEEKARMIYSENEKGETLMMRVENINPYLIGGEETIIVKESVPISSLDEMLKGNMPVDDGNLLFTADELLSLNLTQKQHDCFIRKILGSKEFNQGIERYCLWIEDENYQEAQKIETIKKRIDAVREVRLASRDQGTNLMAERAHQFREMNIGKTHAIIIPAVSSQNRDFLPCGLLNSTTIISNLAFALYDSPIWNLSIIASRLHLVWISTVCGKMKTDFRYSNVMGWNTFPVPELTNQQKEELTRCAEDILLAREVHFPKTIADLYKPEDMPDNLRMAHEKNDEALERIYIGRRFKNDTERLQTLFDLYTKMIAAREKAATTGESESG